MENRLLQIMRIYILNFLLLIVPIVVKAQRWIPIDESSQGACITFDVIESSQSAYKVKATIHGIYETPIVHEDTLYHQISIGDYSFSGELGFPQLPIVSQIIALPSDSYSIKVEELAWKQFFIGNLYPVQPPLHEGELPSSFYKNAETYSSSLYLPSQLLNDTRYRYRGIENIAIEICPFKYSPTTGNLSVLSEFIIIVEFTGREVLSKARALTDSKIESYKALYDNANILCPSTSNRHNELRNNTDVDYLIIVGNINGILNSTALNDFRRWKAFKGYNTKVVTTADTGTTDTSIKTYIANEYANHPELSYVLFIGNQAAIQSHHMDGVVSDHGIDSDYWYGCINPASPYFSELAIGRFSVCNVDELTNMVTKTIEYENNPPDYTTDALLIAHKENAPYSYSFQGCLETVRTSIYSESPSFITAYGADVEHGGDCATNHDVVTHICNNINIVNYRGHGGWNDWSEWNTNNENFNDSLICQMSDYTRSVFLSIACWTGCILITPCMLENFTRSNHGAVAFLGATNASWRNANNQFNKNLINYIYNQNCYHLGYVNVLSHVDNIQSANSSYAKENALIYLLGGDPSLELWTGTPQEITNVIVQESNVVHIQIPDLSDFQVSVVNENSELIGTGTTSNGICTFNLPTENVYYVINRHNYKPYIIKYDVNTNCIQNTTLNYNAYYYKRTPFSIGYNVDNSQPFGNVILKDGSSLNLCKDQGITIKNGFMMEKGATLIIE